MSGSSSSSSLSSEEQSANEDEIMFRAEIQPNMISSPNVDESNNWTFSISSDEIDSIDLNRALPNDETPSQVSGYRMKNKCIS
jgi:hypothetical protein